MEPTAKAEAHTPIRIKHLFLYDSLLRARAVFRAMFTYLSNPIKPIEKIAAPKNVSVVGIMYRQKARPSDHLNGSSSFKMAIGKLKISVQRSAIARLKRYWLAGPSTLGFWIITTQTVTFPITPKKPRAIWKPIRKMATPNGSLSRRYTGNVTLVSKQLVLISIHPKYLC